MRPRPSEGFRGRNDYDLFVPTRQDTFFGPQYLRMRMSSDDSSDSGFDKEAEREKLREKYEQDEQDRENTRRMSELLLQGATMTGKHCGECGDPIFRYDGQEFCPTCQREVEGGAGEQGASERGEGEVSADEEGVDEKDATEGERETPDGETDEEVTDDEPRVEINDVRVADQHADRSNLRQPPSQQSERDQHGLTEHQHDAATRRESSQSGSHDHSHESARAPHERERAPSSGRTHSGRPARAPRDDAGDLATARESLVRKLTDLARRAEETDDVARSRDLLAATREAAEALAALDRANR